MSNEKYIKKCGFSIDTGCVEVEFLDGMQMSIDCTAVEDELDYLIYNDPVSYVNLVLCGKTNGYLKSVTEYNNLTN